MFVRKFYIAILLAFFLAGFAWAQEEGDSTEVQTESQAEASEAAAAEDEDEIDDSDLDEQTYEEDEDDFIPTEEIPADEPIPFPSNI
jgi:adenine-specific DNA methylase